MNSHTDNFIAVSTFFTDSCSKIVEQTSGCCCCCRGSRRHFNRCRCCCLCVLRLSNSCYKWRLFSKLAFTRDASDESFSAGNCTIVRGSPSYIDARPSFPPLNLFCVTLPLCIFRRFCPEKALSITDELRAPLSFTFQLPLTDPQPLIEGDSCSLFSPQSASILTPGRHAEYHGSIVPQ